MKTLDTPLAGLKIVELNLFPDERGFFVERYNERKFQEAGLPTRFVQDNHSLSIPGVLRGMHFQIEPGQGKLVGCIRGRIFDVVVDVRRDSSTFGKWFGVELSAANGKLLWVPSGFAHGFCVLGEEPADVFYKVDSFYDPARERGLRWDDPEIGIKWPVKDPILTKKDQALPSLSVLFPA